jgi:hypothetical protein
MRLGAAFAACWIALVIAACGRQPQQQPAPAPGVGNEQLGLHLAAVPDGFVVDINEGDRLELRSANPEEQGRVRFLVGPEENGVNLVAAVHAHQAAIESLPQGIYKGAQELQGPLGAAFYSRGRFLNESGPVEETRIYALHPLGNRLLTIEYRYATADDSSSRVTRLIEVLAEID